MNIIVGVLLVGIIASLAVALYCLVNKENEPAKMAKALTWRISLSLALFFLAILSFLMGWISPHGI
jgi:hypothetical protein